MSPSAACGSSTSRSTGEAAETNSKRCSRVGTPGGRIKELWRRILAAYVPLCGDGRALLARGGGCARTHTPVLGPLDRDARTVTVSDEQLVRVHSAMTR